MREKTVRLALEITDVRQAFRTGFWMQKTEVLHGFSFSVPEKSVFGFLGANGAGKTTLIHMIAGLRQPTWGQVKVFGQDAYTPAARTLIGYLPERPYFHEHLTGEGLLRYLGTLSGMKKSRLLKRIPHVLEEVGMAHARHQELRKYSKGMLQRIGIAQALLHDPPFLVLDEPMSGLDPTGRKEMRELIVRLAGDGRTIFFSSHVIPDVEAICDQVALIQKGKLIGCGPIGQLISHGPLQTEVAFTGMDFADAKKIKEFTSLRQIPDGIRAVVGDDEGSQAAVQRVLAQLVKKEAQVLWVTPIRPSLEDLFETGGKRG